jgi:DNA methylase
VWQSELMRTYAMIRAKRALDKAEAQRKLRAAREQFLLLPEAEKIDLRTCSMRDLLGAIADGSLDAIVSDPLVCVPYGELAQLAARKLKPEGTLAVTCAQSHLPQALIEMFGHIRYRLTMCLMTPNPAQVSEARVSTSWKPVIVFGHGQKWMGDVVKDVEKLVERLTEPAAMVADPFLGTGEMAAACVRLSRRIVGCDLDELRVEKVRVRTAFFVD